MNTGPEKHHKMAQTLQGDDPVNIESSLMDLIYEIEESPAHIELPLSLQSVIDVLARRIIDRSWSDEYLAMGFFVLGKAAVYPGRMDVTKIASEIILEVRTKNEARQVLVAIENQTFCDQSIDLNAAKLVLDFLLKSQGCWNNDAELRDRVIEELNEKIRQDSLA